MRTSLRSVVAGAHACILEVLSQIVIWAQEISYAMLNLPTVSYHYMIHDTNSTH